MPIEPLRSDYVLIRPLVLRQRIEMLYQGKVSYLKVEPRTRTYKKSYILLEREQESKNEKKIWLLIARSKLSKMIRGVKQEIALPLTHITRQPRDPYNVSSTSQISKPGVLRQSLEPKNKGEMPNRRRGLA